MYQKIINEKEFIALFALLTSLTALSIDAVLPAFPAISKTLQFSNYQNTQLIISALILGMAGGELFFGPLSDAIGRIKAIMLGIIIYLIGSALCLMATDLDSLLMGRVIQGVGLAGPKIASRALIRDLYKGAAMARIMSFVMMVFILVPMLAPIFGQFLLSISDWRGIFWAFIVQAVFAGGWLIFRQEETLDPSKRIPFSFKTVGITSLWILKHKIVMCYTVTAGITFGGMMLYLSTAQSIFQDLYQTGDTFPYYFALFALGIGSAGLINGKLVIRFGMYSLTRVSLFVMTGASLSLLIMSLFYGGVPPFYYFLALGMIMFFCKGFLFGNINAMAMEHLGKIAGIGASIIASVSSLIAILMSYTVGRFYNDSLIPLATGFLLSAISALILIEIAARIRASGEV
ncbi:multidrug effflux MFS transporter [Marinomonas sp. 2405UD68-3]|uniref:multidrug effflux MFS transporter n=1 Tax=Marinomonas sp. 2405UD68-3 TaxID=3391835 RepID=UPI0039C8C836